MERSLPSERVAHARNRNRELVALKEEPESAPGAQVFRKRFADLMLQIYTHSVVIQTRGLGTKTARCLHYALWHPLLMLGGELMTIVAVAIMCVMCVHE